MTDTELMDFVDKNGIQIWPVRKSKHGPILHWYVQNPAPWCQMYGATVREALMKLKKAIDGPTP